MGLLKKILGLESKKSDESGKIVIFRTYPTLGEAHVAKTYLIENEIPAMVGSESELYIPMVKDGFSVMVFKRDVERANELMDTRAE